MLLVLNPARVYPITKFWLVLCFFVNALLLQSLFEKFLCFAVLNIVALVCGVYRKFLKYLIFTVGMIIFPMIVLQSIFYPGSTVLFQMKFFVITLEGVLFALQLSMSFVIGVGALVWFFAVTEKRDFIYALEFEGMHPKITYLVLSSLYIIEVLQKKVFVIIQAQQSRGLETQGSLWIRIRSFFPIIAPLILSIMMSAEDKVLALESRGFSVPCQKTSLYEISKSRLDIILIKLFQTIMVLTFVRWSMIWVL